MDDGGRQDEAQGKPRQETQPKAAQWDGERIARQFPIGEEQNLLIDDYQQHEAFIKKAGTAIVAQKAAAITTLAPCRKRTSQ